MKIQKNGKKTLNSLSKKKEKVNFCGWILNTLHIAWFPPTKDSKNFKKEKECLLKYMYLNNPIGIPNEIEHALQIVKEKKKLQKMCKRQVTCWSSVDFLQFLKNHAQWAHQQEQFVSQKIAQA